MCVGPMSSIHRNQSTYCYAPGYMGATDPRCKGSYIKAGGGEDRKGPQNGSHLGVGVAGVITVQERRSRVVWSEGGWVG